MFNIEEYIVSHGVEVVRDDGAELACLCPFHKNTDSPAFYINKNTGLWICFNPSCAKRGSIRDLMEFFGDKKPLIKEHSLSEIQKLLVEDEPPQAEDWDASLESIRLKFPGDEEKCEYFINRGFSTETLQYFEIGFSSKRRRFVIPARNEQSRLVGFIGRTPDANVQPKYLYSKGFPRKDILFNLNHAKRYDSVVVVEGSLDAIKIHQAGFSNVVATLGATVTANHISLLNKYFDEIIIFSDNDEAGQHMAQLIISGCSGKMVKVVDYSETELKDPGDMGPDLISDMIHNAQDWLASQLSVI
jgi:DNA primase